MEVLNKTDILFNEIFNDACQLTPSEGELAFKTLLDGVDEHDIDDYAMINLFFDNYPYLRGIGTDYYDVDNLNSEHKIILSRHLRWIIDSVKKWEKEKGMNHFSVICQMIRIFNWETFFWEKLKEYELANKEWNDKCKEVIGSITAKVQPSTFDRNPISFESENQAFQFADKNQDWEQVALFLQSEGQSFYPPIVKESLRYLYFTQFDELLEIFEGVDSSILAVVYADCLSSFERLVIAERTRNSYVRFIFTHQALKQGVDQKCEKLLLKILITVSEIKCEWAKWLKVFNRYPVRFPNLQSIFGKVISGGNKSAIKEYIHSLNLVVHPHNERELVFNCLSAFERLASKESRVYAWQTAYERWVDWNFGSSSSESLMEVTQSALDFALVGFFIEVQPERMDDVTEKISKELNAIQDEWHISSVSLITEKNRLLSHFQPILHAKAVLEQSKEWYYPQTQCYVLNYKPEWHRYMSLKETI
ncbi:hypothetical protein VP758_000302 [Vibrio harveyi]|nr:hypothetical protein [Vibrio harveyi]